MDELCKQIDDIVIRGKSRIQDEALWGENVNPQKFMIKNEKSIYLKSINKEFIPKYKIVRI